MVDTKSAAGAPDSAPHSDRLPADAALDLCPNESRSFAHPALRWGAISESMSFAALLSASSDLVRDSKLETRFPRDPVEETAHPPHTLHVFYESGQKSHERLVKRQEIWTRQKLLARGGSGSIWLEKCVRGNKLDETRAVKQIPRSERGKVIDYHRELDALAKFSHARYHRCFVQSFGWYEWKNALLISMEYLSSGDLHDYLEVSSSALSEIEAKQITFQLLEGLSFMHDNGFEHRDLKPRV